MEIEGIGEASTAALRLISEVPSYKITKPLEIPIFPPSCMGEAYIAVYIMPSLDMPNC